MMNFNEQYVLNRKIIISEHITDQLADRVIEHLLVISDYDDKMASELQNYSPEPIEIFINSGGGSATAGFAIISAMEMCSTPIVTYGMGIVASMALAIFVAGDIRIAHRFCRFMFHQVQYGEEGTLQDHMDSVKEVSVIQEMYIGLMTENTEFPVELMTEICEKKKNYFFSGNKAVKYGVAHEVMLKPEPKIKGITESEFEQLVKEVAEKESGR